MGLQKRYRAGFDNPPHTQEQYYPQISRQKYVTQLEWEEKNNLERF